MKRYAWSWHFTFCVADGDRNRIVSVTSSYEDQEIPRYKAYRRAVKAVEREYPHRPWVVVGPIVPSNERARSAA